MCHVEMQLIALVPASQALWDREFVEAVSDAQRWVGRMLAWTRYMMHLKVPQLLLVPGGKDE